jgi:rhodanese-related sulfurtransferase
MDTGRLQALLDDPEGADWLIVDARHHAEFATSHLPGAVPIAPAASTRKADIAAMADSRKRPVLVVCSVGVRSARLALELKRRGYEQVWHLDGGLFAWVNEGHSLLGQGRPTRLVHPYNRLWGLLLRSAQD